jgi:hypothetical protein
VEIETAGTKVLATAEQLHGTERDEAWQQIIAAAPRLAKYHDKSDRLLPMIRLVPEPDATPDCPIRCGAAPAHWPGTRAR